MLEFPLLFLRWWRGRGLSRWNDLWRRRRNADNTAGLYAVLSTTATVGARPQILWPHIKTAPPLLLLCRWRRGLVLWNNPWRRRWNADNTAGLYASVDVPRKIDGSRSWIVIAHLAGLRLLALRRRRHRRLVAWRRRHDERLWGWYFHQARRFDAFIHVTPSAIW